MINNPLLVLFICLCFGALLCGRYSQNKIRGNKIFMFLSLMAMLVFRTFLDINSVPDLPAYSSGFSQLSQVPISQVAVSELYRVKMPEFGFRLFMKIVSYISDRFDFFLLVYGLIWILGFRIVIKRYSPFVIVSILFLFLDVYLQSIFVLRQHLAFLIVLFSYKYIIEKKLVPYLISMAIAFSFHQSAIIAIPLFFFYHIRNRRTLLLAFVVTALVGYFYFSVLLKHMADEVLIGMSSYIDSDKVTNFTSFILASLHLFFFIFFLRKDIFNEGINKVLFVSLVFGVLLSLLGVGHNPTGRLLVYMTGISFIEIPVVMSYIKSSLIKNLYMLTLLGFSVYIGFYGSQMSSIANFTF